MTVLQVQLIVPTTTGMTDMNSVKRRDMFPLWQLKGIFFFTEPIYQGKIFKYSTAYLACIIHCVCYISEMDDCVYNCSFFIVRLLPVRLILRAEGGEYVANVFHLVHLLWLDCAIGVLASIECIVLLSAVHLHALCQYSNVTLVPLIRHRYLCCRFFT